MQLPSEAVKLHGNLTSEGWSQHLRCYRDARTRLWKDEAAAPELLRPARRAGVEAAGLSAQVWQLTGFFAANPPPKDEGPRVGQTFSNPGTPHGCLDGRQLDSRASCTRLRI